MKPRLSRMEPGMLKADGRTTSTKDNPRCAPDPSLYRYTVFAVTNFEQNRLTTDFVRCDYVGSRKPEDIFLWQRPATSRAICPHSWKCWSQQGPWSLIHPPKDVRFSADTGLQEMNSRLFLHIQVCNNINLFNLYLERRAPINYAISRPFLFA
jgi:hypothetical protein